MPIFLVGSGHFRLPHRANKKMIKSIRFVIEFTEWMVIYLYTFSNSQTVNTRCNRNGQKMRRRATKTGAGCDHVIQLCMRLLFGNIQEEKTHTHTTIISIWIAHHLFYGFCCCCCCCRVYGMLNIKSNFMLLLPVLHTMQIIRICVLTTWFLSQRYL